MKFVFSLVAAASLATLLAACTTAPTVASASSDGVTIQRGGDQSLGQYEADNACAQYGKKARYRDQHQQANGYNLAIYDCVPR